jgi:hypothetical protein
VTALLFIWFGWSALALLLGLFLGLCIRQADEIEQPADTEVVADFELRRLEGWL